MLLCRTGPLPCKSVKTTGCKMLPPLRLPAGRQVRTRSMLRQLLLCPSDAQASIVLPDFARSCSADEENFKFIALLNELKNKRALG